MEVYLGKINLLIVFHKLVKLVQHFNSVLQRWKLTRSLIIHYAVD